MLLEDNMTLMHSRMISIAATLAAGFLSFSARAQSLTPVHASLQYRESEHFRYIYQESLAERLPHLAKCCEDAHAMLSPIMKWGPRRKTVVFYFDNEDVHNGWATVYPRPAMMILASDAPPGSTIYEPGDYIRRTVVHEYTHILTMDAQYGVDKVLSRIFGKSNTAGDMLSVLLTVLSASPGVLAPAWYTEGLAMWAETELAGPGRGRATMIDSYMRVAVADKRVLTPRQWTLDHPEWPYGVAAYMYGMKTIEHIHDTYSFGPNEINVVGDVSDSVSHSFWYNLNMRPRTATKKKFSHLAADAMKAETDRQNKRIAKLKSMPTTKLTFLTPDRLSVSSPRFGPDGTTVFFSGGEEAGRDTLYQYDVRSKSVRKIRSARTTYSTYSELAPSGDRSAIYYTRLDVHGRDRTRNEVYRLDTRKKSSRRVARKGRYRHPAISPDGLKLAAVVNRAGMQSLVEVLIAEAGQAESEETLVASMPLVTLVDPVYSPDGRSLVFVRANESGSSLITLDLASGNPTELLSWDCIIVSPTFHPDGKELVFCSDRNGVYNLYRMPASPKSPATALTHVVGGVSEPDFSLDGTLLAASSWDSYGKHLVIMDYAKLMPLGLGIPAITSDWRSLKSNLAAKAKAENSSIPKLTPSRKYVSITGLRMDGWFPWGTITESSAAGGISASFSDLAQFHAIQIMGGSDTDSGSAVGAAMYQYSGLYPILQVYGGAAPDIYYDLLTDASGTYYDYGEDVNYAGLAMSFPWPRVDWQLGLSLGYQFSDRSENTSISVDYRNRTISPTNLFVGTESSLWAGLNLFTGTAYRRSHSLESGRIISAVVAWSDESIGSDIDRTALRTDWIEYISMPWAENHVLRLEGVYATGDGDSSAQGLFGLGQGAGAMADVPGLDRAIYLRGYSPNTQVGTEAMKVGIAYRFPVFRLYRNINATSPFYFHQLFGELFYEGGMATGAELAGTPKNTWIGAGGLELNFSTTLFRLASVAPGIGVVYAPDRMARTRASDPAGAADDSKLQIYISLKSVINF